MPWLEVSATASWRLIAAGSMQLNTAVIPGAMVSLHLFNPLPAADWKGPAAATQLPCSALLLQLNTANASLHVAAAYNVAADKDGVCVCVGLQGVHGCAESHLPGECASI